MNIFFQLLKYLCAVLLLQTLFFKFSAAPESVYIFETLKVEPWGRIFAGISELIAVILLLIPKTKFFGASMTVGIMGGAILSHLVFLGIEVQGDSGLLFGMAVFIMLSALILSAKFFPEFNKDFLQRAKLN